MSPSSSASWGRPGGGLAWVEDGAGTPMVLVNGYGGAAADWDPSFVGALARRFRLIRPDNPGMGASPLSAGGSLDVDTMADELSALLDRLGLERVALVGWSMGGYIAQALARREPRRIIGMTLLSTDAGGPSAVRAEPQVWARLTDHDGTPPQQAARIIGLLFPPAAAVRVQEVAGAAVAAARAALDPRALDAQEAAMRDWHAREQPPAPTSPPPVLVLAGGEDIVVPVENAAIVAAHWAADAPMIVPDGGHAFMAQYPDRVAEAIADFLDDKG